MKLNFVWSFEVVQSSNRSILLDLSCVLQLLTSLIMFDDVPEQVFCPITLCSSMLYPLLITLYLPAMCLCRLY